VAIVNLLVGKQFIETTQIHVFDRNVRRRSRGLRRQQRRDVGDGQRPLLGQQLP
jgi:hypothetical protein